MRLQALIILAAISGHAGAAVAEETVETTDGRRILLRDDGRYEILPAGTLPLPTCKPAEGYTERDVLTVERDQQRLIEQHRKVCVVARLEDSTEKIASLAILEAPESVESTSGWVDLSTQREEVRDYLVDNCGGRKHPRGWCIVAIYGTITPYPSWGGQWIIVPDRLEFRP
jgi:hypothetical protein